MKNEAYCTIHMDKVEHDVMYKALKQYLVYLFEKVIDWNDKINMMSELRDYLVCSMMVDGIEEALKEKQDAN